MPKRKTRKKKQIKPIQQQPEPDEIPVTVKPEAPPIISKPKSVTDKTLIDESVFELRNLGFKKRDAVIAVERACNGKVFTNVEDVIIATFDRSNV